MVVIVRQVVAADRNAVVVVLVAVGPRVRRASGPTVARRLAVLVVARRVVEGRAGFDSVAGPRLKVANV